MPCDEGSSTAAVHVGLYEMYSYVRAPWGKLRGSQAAFHVVNVIVFDLDVGRTVVLVIVAAVVKS